MDVGLDGGKESFGVAAGAGGAAEVVGVLGRAGNEGAGVGSKAVGGADLLRDGLGPVGVIGFKVCAFFGGGGAAVVLATASPVYGISISSIISLPFC